MSAEGPKPESSRELSEAKEEFNVCFPVYAGTRILDDLREREFSRLDRLGHVYVDYTGGGLFGDSQVTDHMAFLTDSVLGNPHSTNPTSALANERVAQCRRRVLTFFNADPDEYVLIFTSNASGALKLVGESYPFAEGDRFLLTFDNHNSVVGIRAFDRVKQATTRYLPVEPPDLRISDETVTRFLDEGTEARNKLFAFPAQSNFSGVQHPLEWIERAQLRGWDVLLDAAAFVPTSRLDLSRWRPDYLTLSFYKMFGYPTGVGALLARRSALAKLHRPWFAGGTISWASVLADSHTLSPGSEGFEDGTLNYTSLPAVEIGLDFLDAVGIETIHTRVRCLTEWLMTRLLAMRHGNGERVVRIYGPIDMDSRGGSLALNLYDVAGKPIDHRTVEERANAWKISLRTGCFCNPGAGELAMGLERDEIVGCLVRSGNRLTLDQFQQCIDDKSTGAVRISFGIASTFEDAFTVLRFFQEFRED